MYDLNLKNADGGLLVKLSGFKNIYDAEDVYLKLYEKRIVQSENRDSLIEDDVVFCFTLSDPKTNQEYRVEHLT